MTKQVKIYAGSDTYEKWQQICERFSSNTAAFAVVVENYFNQIQEDTMNTAQQERAMNTERTQVEQWSDSDRRFIATQALDDAESGAHLLTLYDGDELVAVASLEDDGTLMNMATKRRGWGDAILTEVARWAMDNNVEVSGLSTDQAIRFYAYHGFEIEGFPGENSGVPIWWSEQNMSAFLAGGEAREKMQAAARAEFDEFVEEYELEVY